MKSAFGNQQFKPKNKRSGYKSEPKASDSLFSNWLNRHGVARQVQSSMVVTVANETLRQILPLHAKPDVKAVWFQRGELLIGCRHPMAIEVVQEIEEQLKIAVLRSYPDLSLEKITPRFYPQAFE